MVLFNSKIISKEMIKPSSPTPNHLKTLNLSFLDQIAPQVHVPLIFFYHNNNVNLDTTEISKMLKQSLSNVLTQFSPLVGTIDQENSFIHCNDVGAELIEARVNARLIKVIEEPKVEVLKELLPVDPLGQIAEKAILSVKVSLFDCGGIAVAVCLSHKIADGSSLVAFINAWAATCRGGEADITKANKCEIAQPSFDLAVHFPPAGDLFGAGVNPNFGVTKEKITTKRLVFTKENLAKLKQLANSCEVKNPTRVEAVSAFIWQHFIKAAKAKPNMNKTSSFAAVHAVNLRPRTIPPIPETTFGNCWRAAFAFLSKTEDCSFDQLVTKLRASIGEVDEGYIKTLRNGEYLSGLSKSIDMFKRGTEVCNFSSWCRFPMYEVDFGWGKPVWVCTTTMPFKNLVILMSSPSGDGIEAWVNVPDDDLKMLESHCRKLLGHNY